MKFLQMIFYTYTHVNISICFRAGMLLLFQLFNALLKKKKGGKPEILRSTTEKCLCCSYN